MIKLKLLFCLLLLAGAKLLQAQELQAKVTILTQSLPTSVSKQRFNTLQSQLTNLLNNRKWTDDRYTAQEKIECNFLLNITESTGDDIFKATVTIQAARPIYHSSTNHPSLTFRIRM